jgi:hypothetical protein
MRITPLPTAVTVVIAAFMVTLGPSPATTAVAGMQKGKPTPPPPPPSTYSVTLGPSIYDDPTSTGNEEDHPDGSLDGLKSAGHLELPASNLSGSFSGPNSNGNFMGTIGGPIAGLVITGVDELPDWYAEGNPCQENEVLQLRALGLVGAPLSGTLTWTFKQLTGSLKTKPRIDWRLDGVMDSQGATWSLVGHSGSTNPEFFPFYEAGSTGDDLIATVENSAIDFLGSTMTVLKCRTDFTMTVTKVSAPDR